VVDGGGGGGGAVGAGGGGAVGAVGAVAKEAPHAAQNTESGVFADPHSGQIIELTFYLPLQSGFVIKTASRFYITFQDCKEP
jgi:hypothetical protein